MGFPFDFIGEDDMTELINSANKVTLLQRTDGFGNSAPTLTLADNSMTLTAGVGTNSGGEIYSPQPLIASVGVAIGGSVIDLELVKGGSDMPRPAQGSFTVQGDIMVNASVRNGMELIHRNITQDRNPSYEYAGGGSFPAEQNVLADDTPLAGASDADITYTLTSTPAVVQIDSTMIEYEVEPKVELSGTPAVNSDSLEGVVEITGTDRNDVTIKRVARFSGTLASGDAKSVGGYFKTIESIKCSGFTTATEGGVTVDDNATKVTYEPYDLAISDYLDMELDIGNLVPFGFFSGVVNGVGFNFTRDAVVQYTLGCLFGQVNIRESLIGAATVPAIPATIEKADSEVFVGTQCEVEVDGTIIPLDSAALNMSQNYVPSPYIGKTIWPKKPRRSGYRTLNLNLTFPATVDNNWLQYFQAHADFENVIVRAKDGAEGTSGKFGGIIEWSFYNLVLSESPAISTPGQDVASQSAALMPYSDNEDAAFNIAQIQNGYERLYRYA